MKQKILRFTWYSLGLILFLLALWAMPVQAQQPTSSDFVYTVQEGDTLYLVALHYNLDPIQLAIANQLTNSNLIYPGQQLILPGVPLPTPTPTFSNNAPSPLYGGSNSANRVPLTETLATLGTQEHVVQTGDTLFNIAARYGVSISEIITLNGLANPDALRIGQRLHIPGGPPPTPQPLAMPFASITFSEPVIIQGRTLVVEVALEQPATISGSFEGRSLVFVGNEQRKWAIVAIHALTEPGAYPVSFTAGLSDGRQVTTARNLVVVAGPYSSENIALAEGRESLLDPEIIRTEWAKLNDLWTQVTPQPRWQGPFAYPVEASSVYITSNYGTRRTYNNGPSLSFHGGTDFGGGIGRPLYAPAPGRVVLAESLDIRGNAVLVDHGMGLFSGYWHQDSIAVQAGQELQTGDLIGYLGDTGLVTGPHLHWEMRLQGIAVEPLQWISQEIP